MLYVGSKLRLSQGAPEQPRTTEGPPVQHAASSKRDNRGTDFFGLIRPRRAAVSGCQAALDTTIVAPPPRSTHLTFSTSLKLPSARTHARARARLVEVAPPSRARENALLSEMEGLGSPPHAHAPLPIPRTPTAQPQDAQPQDAQIRAAYGNFLRGMRRDIVRPFLMGAAAAFGSLLGLPCLRRSNQPTARC